MRLLATFSLLLVLNITVLLLFLFCSFRISSRISRIEERMRLEDVCKNR